MMSEWMISVVFWGAGIYMILWTIGDIIHRCLIVKKLEMRIEIEKEKNQTLRIQLGSIEELADRTIKEEELVDDEWQNE